MSEIRHPTPLLPTARAGRHFLFAVLALGLIIAALHGRCVFHGLFLDDHAHFRQLRAASWTLTDLVGACRLELVGGALDVWFLPDCTLRFFRPVSFAFMKLMYELSDWNPALLHVTSLLWHWLVCVLIMVLGQQLTGQKRIGWGVAAFFAVHPAHIATVQWIAAQTELMVTAFLLISLLSYGTWRGWFVWRQSLGERSAAPPRPSVGWIVLAFITFVLACGCRENAALFPPVLIVAELLHRRPWSRGVVAVHIGFWVLLAGYVALRTAMLGAQGVPPPPYVYSPTAPGFFAFIFNKACYYLLGEFFIVPIVPFGGLAYFGPRPLLFYGLTAVCVGLIAAAWWFHRRRLGGCLGALWLFLLMGPVLPVFESPHHLYLPGVGWAIVMAMLLGSVNDLLARLQGASRRAVESSVWFVGVSAALFLAFISYFCSLAMDMGQSVEDRVADEIIDSPVKLQDGDTVYIANMPILAHYAKYIVEARTGLKDLRFIVLTWSPRVLGVLSPTELRWIDQRTVEVEVADDRYFDGPYGELVKEAGHPEIAVAHDKPIVWKDLKIWIVDADHEGVKKLRFDLGPCAESGKAHFFWGSRTRWAGQVPMGGSR